MRYLLILATLPVLFSFTFSPMQQTIKIHEDQKFVRFLVENTSSETIPVIFKVLTREQNLDGSEKNNETTDLSIFPPQMILASGQKKAVRVTYKGELTFSKEKAFRVIAQQVPVDLKSKQKSAGIKMLLKFQNALYVQNKEYRSHLAIESFKVDGRKMKLVIRNSGNSHQYLQNLKIKFKKNKEVIELDSKELSKLDGQNILADSSREYEFTAVKGLTQEHKGLITFD